MPISKEKMDAVADDFAYLSDNLPSSEKKLDRLLSDYEHANDNKERAKILWKLHDIAEEICGHANDALGSFDGVADDVDETLGE